MKPFFSIIIPAYNRADLLSETLVSIKNQSFTDWECIIVDDGSTDNTKEVIEEESKKDDRIRYIYQKNAERSAARNNGARNANGDFLCFLDSDDCFASNYLEELFQNIQKDGFQEALYVTNFFIWDGVKSEEMITPPISNPVADWLFHYPVSPSRACVHKNCFKKYQFREDIVIVEDTVLWVSIANEFSVKQIEKPLVYYRVHEGNSVRKGTKSSFSRYEGMKLFFNEPLSNIVSKKVKKEMISDVRFRIAEYYQSKNSNFLAIKFAIHSILTQITHSQTKMKVFFLLEMVPGFKTFWRKK
jgi:glycosyltransferase involved in cell wall biosynthesis